MTVLDASVLIAHLNPADAHHGAAGQLISTVPDGLAMSPLTLAEVLVAPVRLGQVARVDGALSTLGMRIAPLLDDAPVRLADLRVRTGLRMPDCCVVLAAQQLGEPLATFDRRLADQARMLGMIVLGQPPT